MVEEVYWLICYLCPKEEDSGMVMSSVVVNVQMCEGGGGGGEKRGPWGLGKGTKNVAVDSEQRDNKGRSS